MVESAGAGNITMLVAILSLIGGALLGLLDLRVVAFIAILYAAFIGYIFFFRSAGGDIGRVIMFMGWMWVVVSFVGGLMAGVNATASTTLTADVSVTDTTFSVIDTTGFGSSGTLTIGDENIVYTKTTATTFTGSWYKPVVRGASSTTATTHDAGAVVRTKEGSLINNSLNYTIALLSDASGLMAFITIPLAVFSLILNFIFLPISFLGTDMFFLTWIWAVIGLGLLVSIFISMSGGRRV
jgi:hypothetical protein